MAITVNHLPSHIAVLLFVRDAWGLPGADLPPLLTPPDIGDSRLPDAPSAEEWQRRWLDAWQRAWDWYKIEDSDRRPAVPPGWFHEYGLAGVDSAAFAKWFRAARGAPMPPAQPGPERMCLTALIEAWESGLDTIISMPYVGPYARRITRRHLVVSNHTHEDPPLYRQALRLPAPH